jgi:hypothetical protein
MMFVLFVLKKNEFNDGRLYATLTYVIIIVCGKEKKIHFIVYFSNQRIFVWLHMIIFSI